MSRIKELNEKIRTIVLDAMEEKHLTPLKLARLAKVSNTAMSNYIKGRTQCMHPDNAMKVYLALGSEVQEKVYNALNEYFNSNQIEKMYS